MNKSPDKIDSAGLIYDNYLMAVIFLIIGIASTALGELVFYSIRSIGVVFVGSTYVYLWKTHKNLGGRDYIFISSKYTRITDNGIVLLWFIVLSLITYFLNAGISILGGLGYVSPLSLFGITQCCFILFVTIWFQVITTKIREKLLTVGYQSGSILKFMCEIRARSQQ